MGCALDRLARLVSDEQVAEVTDVKLSATVELEIALMLSKPSNDPTASTRPCSLAKNPAKPGDNWVTETGGLPTYICNTAKAIMRGGSDTSTAIAIAVSRIKKLIATTKNPQVKEEATKAIAEWEAKRAAADTHHAVKEAHGILSGKSSGSDDSKD